MRRHSHIRRAARRRRQVAAACALLALFAAALVHCQTPEPAERPEAQRGSGNDYRSVDQADAGRAPKADADNDGADDRRAKGAAAAQKLRPANHTADWLERHGGVARANSDECTACHQEEDCATCHTEKTATPYRVHPPNFETIHATDARMQMDDCAECHKPETFCAECHARSGVDPARPDDDPPPGDEFHPPGWLDANAPDNHGVAARRNINECATCHTERDCVTCHQGIDPHPPEFQLDCGRMLRADPRPCAQCHQDLGMLKEMCL